MCIRSAAAFQLYESPLVRTENLIHYYRLWIHYYGFIIPYFYRFLTHNIKLIFFNRSLDFSPSLHRRDPNRKKNSWTRKGVLIPSLFKPVSNLGSISENTARQISFLSKYRVGHQSQQYKPNVILAGNLLLLGYTVLCSGSFCASDFKKVDPIPVARRSCHPVKIWDNLGPISSSCSSAHKFA